MIPFLEPLNKDRDTEIEMVNDQQFKGAKLAHDVVGRSAEDAKDLCNAAGFSMRYLHIDHHSCMITADIRMDRISVSVSRGKVIAAAVG